MPSLLEIERLTVQFHSEESTVHAINGVDLVVPVGKAIAIVGESGSGKSTTMMAVPKLLPTNADVGGRILFKGKNILSMSSKEIRTIRGKEIAMIFQNPSAFLNPIKKIGEQLIEPVLYHHLASKESAKRMAIELLQNVGIPDAEARFHMYPFEFSGGMLQRAMIAMALMADPLLLIADEPTTGLDVTVQSEILILLKKLQLERGMSMVFITHDLAVAAQVSDEIYVMYGGLVMEHIRAEQLVTHSTHPYLKGLLASIPKLDGPRERLSYIPGQPINTNQPLAAGCVFADRCDMKMEHCGARPQLSTLDEGHEVACWRVQEGIRA